MENKDKLQKIKDLASENIRSTLEEISWLKDLYKNSVSNKRFMYIFEENENRRKSREEVEISTSNRVYKERIFIYFANLILNYISSLKSYSELYNLYDSGDDFLSSLNDELKIYSLMISNLKIDLLDDLSNYWHKYRISNRFEEIMDGLDCKPRTPANAYNLTKILWNTYEECEDSELKILMLNQEEALKRLITLIYDLSVISEEVKSKKEDINEKDRLEHIHFLQKFYRHLGTD